MRVEQRRGAGVGEALALHDVAPVAREVAYGDEDQPVARRRASRDEVRAPLPPVHGDRPRAAAGRAMRSAPGRWWVRARANPDPRDDDERKSASTTAADAPRPAGCVPGPIGTPPRLPVTTRTGFYRGPGDSDRRGWGTTATWSESEPRSASLAAAYGDADSCEARNASRAMNFSISSIALVISLTMSLAVTGPTMARDVLAAAGRRRTWTAVP